MLSEVTLLVLWTSYFGILVLRPLHMTLGLHYAAIRRLGLRQPASRIRQLVNVTRNLG